MRLRRATLDDAQLLGAMNERLIVDEGHETPLRGDALAARMRGWLVDGGYEAAVGEVDGQPALYALWRPGDIGVVHLRQFFVERSHRRGGIGRLAIDELRRSWWPPTVTLDVLVTNERGRAFWQAVGFEPYALRLRASGP